MIIGLLVLSALSLLALVTGAVLGFRSHGSRSARSGNEVHRDLVSDSLDRDAQRSGSALQASRVATRGHGREVSVEVRYSYGDMLALLRSGDPRRYLPVLLILGGIEGLFLFGGLTLLCLGGVAGILGVVVIAIGVYGTLILIRGLRRAASPPA